MIMPTTPLITVRMHATAWHHRQWQWLLPQCQHGVKRLGSSTTASTSPVAVLAYYAARSPLSLSCRRPLSPPALSMIIIPNQHHHRLRCLGSSSASAADNGGHNNPTEDEGAVSSSSPPPIKPRASSKWGNQSQRRVSNRLFEEHDNYTAARVVGQQQQQQIKTLPSFDMDNFGALEKSMGNNTVDTSAHGTATIRNPPPNSNGCNNNNPPRHHDAKNRNHSQQQHIDQPYNHHSNYNPETARMLAKFKECKSVNATIQVAHDYNLDKPLTPPCTVAFWKTLSSLVLLAGRPNSHSKTSPNIINQQQQQQQLEELFQHTLLNKNGLEDMNPSQLSNVAQSMATIVKHVSMNHKGGNRRYQHHQQQQEETTIMLYNTFVKHPNSLLFWNKLQDETQSQIDNFRPKWLVSVAWAFATVLNPLTRNTTKYNDGSNPKEQYLLDVSPFFHALHKTYHERKRDFTSKHIGNLAWSCMTTCRGQNVMPLLFHDFANEFIHRRTMDKQREGFISGTDDGIDPTTLSQWANAFAKAGVNNNNNNNDDDDDGNNNKELLFQSISEAAIPLLCEYNARQFANLAHSFALAQVNVNAGQSSWLLLDEMAEAAIPKLATFTTQNMANIVWAYAKMDHASPELFEAVANEAMPRLERFSAQELANLAWAFSKFQSSSSSSSLLSEDNAIFDRIAEEVVARGSLDRFTSQGVAMLAHSFATVGHVTNTDFWDSIDRAATARLSELGPIECSQIAWSFATISRPSDDLFRGIEQSIMTTASKMNCIKPQGLSNLAWSFATLGYDSPNFFEGIAQHSLQRLDEFAPQDKVMLVLAYSRINHQRFPELFDQIASGSLPHLSKFTELDLFNMVMSYVKVGHQPKYWMEAIAEEIVRRRSSSSSNNFPPRLLVGIVWSYASAGCRVPALFDLVSDECIGCCDELNTRELSSLAWSFSTLDYYHRPLLGALADSADGRWHDFDAASLAIMAWAYATAQVDRPHLFEAIANCAIDRQGEFTSQGVSMLLWACSVAGHLDRRLFESLAPTATALLHECNSQALANIAWAYTVADVDADSLFGPKSPFVDIVAEKYDEFDHEGFFQLHQWNLWRKNIMNESTLPPHIEKRCYDEFIDQSLHSSKLQKDVISELVSMGFHLEEEAQTQGGYYVDALVAVNGKNVGVEVDGPHHFVGRKPTGSTILKHRQLAEVDGIPVCSLPYWELNGLKSSVEKQKYLKAKLDDSLR